MRPAVLREGLCGGAAVVAIAVVFAVLGLSPSLRWIPEPPLLAAAFILPVLVFALTGYRAGRGIPRIRRVLAGTLAGGLAGGLGGGAGGLAYVAFGKGALNLVVGTLVGAAIGAAVGGTGARLGPNA